MSIMIHRLHKYDPALYDENGVYTRADEWTAIQEVGRVFHDGVLTRAAYEAVEDAYVRAIRLILDAAGVVRLRASVDAGFLRDLSKIEPWLPKGVGMAEAMAFKEGEWIEGDRLDSFCRLALRNLTGWALSNERDVCAIFTGDMYVHVGLPSAAPKRLRSAVEALGLHLVERGQLGDPGVDTEYYLQVLPRAPVTA